MTKHDTSGSSSDRQAGVEIGVTSEMAIDEIAAQIWEGSFIDGDYVRLSFSDCRDFVRLVLAVAMDERRSKSFCPHFYFRRTDVYFRGRRSDRGSRTQ